MNIIFLIILVFGTLCSDLSFAESKIQETLSLDDLLASAQQKNSLYPLEEKLQKKVSVQMESNGLFFRNPLQLELEGDSSFSKDGDRKVTAIFNQSMSFGVDGQELKKGFEADARSEILTAQKERRDFEIDVAKTYVNLRFLKQKNVLMKATLNDLSPYLKQSIKAGRLGTVGGLLARQLQILKRKIYADLEDAEQAFAATARSLSRALGRPIAENAFSVNLKDLSEKYQKISFKSENHLPSLVNEERQKSLSLRANSTEKIIEVEGGVGLYQDISKNETGVILKISMPIGSGYYATAKANELRAEKETIRAQNDINLAQAIRQFDLLSSGSEIALNRKKIIEKRLTDVTNSYDDVIKLYNKGQADLGDLIELLKEIYEVKTQMNEANKEWEENLVTRYFFAAGEKL